ncbi:MAG: HlyD family efflux transporter periplasmic adaptor subunit [Candidatus Sericytochromatia bacterium]|nr:HlyD family efflux transporter periplasmic adaptor subunit [Candidatus Sericytochromatia bacterium]
MTESDFPLGRLPVWDRVPRTTSARRVARRLARVFLILLVTAALAPWQQNVAGDGTVVAFAPVARQQRVDAPVDGVLAGVRVQEGDRVKAGDLLVEIRDVDARRLERLAGERDLAADRVAEMSGRVSSLEARRLSVADLQRELARGAGARLSEAAARKDAAIQAVGAAEAELEAAVLNLKRHRQLVAKGLVAQRDLELAVAAEARARTGRDAARAQRDAADAALVAARAAVAQAEASLAAETQGAQAAVQAARTELQAARAALLRAETGLARQATQQVRAPRAGMVTRVRPGQGGELIRAGEPLLTLVPETRDRAVALKVDGNNASLIAPGRKVRLQFEGWPAVQFVGWPSVAVGTFGGKVAFVDAVDDGHGDFRVVVIPDKADEPWPSATYLRQGVLVHGWVLLEVVPLGFELWRQFNGFPPSLARAPEEGVVGGKSGAKGGSKDVSGAEDAP